MPMAIALASFYGMTDEFHQSFVPFRYSHVLDWVADTVGAGLGVLLMQRVLNFRPADSISQA